ncbi:MAG: helix-turn-helix transcriptional regulator [Hyphomonadaceae bacterium]|jgi:y4mF family transcriptional regulator|nr:helix-turn-helix transcriptional regulator [Hyphomonadaceae bacterium]
MTPIQFGEIVRSARKRLGLRQDQLAGAAGVGVRFVGDLEAGKPTTHLGKALAVLDALGCRIQIEQPPPLEIER